MNHKLEDILLHKSSIGLYPKHIKNSYKSIIFKMANPIEK